MSLRPTSPNELGVPAALEIQAALPETERRLFDVGPQFRHLFRLDRDSVPMRVVFDQLAAIEPVTEKVGAELG